MIERLGDMPAGTIGFRATGRVSGVRFGLGHHSAWQRCALVTDVDWIVKAFHLLAWMAPGEVRTFGPDELDAAKQWASGSG